jgi:NAD(P)-dependent dehydrogenase (short-subunit alcohol dehydrogenase family)
VNAIAPGPVDTPGAAAQLWAEPAIREALVAKVPLRRFGTEEEIRNLSAYLVSDHAAYITGEVVTIDGGAWLEKGMFGRVSLPESGEPSGS